MTQHQYGTLKFIINNDITIDNLGHYSMATVGSMIIRKWVKRDGNRVIPTQEGIEAFNSFFKAQPNYRKNEADITERVRTLLHISRMLKMPKAG